MYNNFKVQILSCTYSVTSLLRKTIMDNISDEIISCSFFMFTLHILGQ